MNDDIVLVDIASAADDTDKEDNSHYILNFRGVY